MYLNRSRDISAVLRGNIIAYLLFVRLANFL
jgi:hypothetical protein